MQDGFDPGFRGKGFHHRLDEFITAPGKNDQFFRRQQRLRAQQQAKQAN